MQSVAVYGLGYVGCVSAACLASRGSQVIGVDVNSDKLKTLRSGRAPVVEDGIEALVADAIAAGTLQVTDDPDAAFAAADIALVCVGTPSTPTGALSTKYLEQVTATIGSALAATDSWRVVVYRSTMLPGTCEDLLIPLLESASGKRAGVDFGVCVNPEFLREGSSVSDFFNPPKTVIGAADERTAQTLLTLYEGLPGERFTVPVRVAEMIKYADNAFHALKVTFANEIGTICANADVDSRLVMNIFTADTKLNVSAAYLRPGFAFGGSCLPKDVRALTSFARARNLDIPLINSVLDSNESHLRRALNIAVSARRRNIGIFGLSFKPGTDDLRESPMVELAERLFGKGFSIKIYDPSVELSLLIGANRTFIQERLPHIADLLEADSDAVAEHGELLVVYSSAPEVIDSVSRHASGRVILDLVGLPDSASLERRAEYHGIAW